MSKSIGILAVQFFSCMDLNVGNLRSYSFFFLPLLLVSLSQELPFLYNFACKFNSLPRFELKGTEKFLFSK